MESGTEKQEACLRGDIFTSANMIKLFIEKIHGWRASQETDEPAPQGLLDAYYLRLCDWMQEWIVAREKLRTLKLLEKNININKY